MNNYLCPNCNGALLYTLLTSNPPIPQYQCPRCGWTAQGRKTDELRDSVFAPDENWNVISDGRQIASDPLLIAGLQIGEVVRHLGTQECYVITGSYGKRATGIRTADICNPQEWERVSSQLMPRDAIAQEINARAMNMAEAMVAGTHPDKVLIDRRKPIEEPVEVEE